MTAPDPLADLCCARLAVGSLPHLAGLRTWREVRAQLVEGAVWVYWPADDATVLHRILAVQGAELFERRGGLWYRPGQHLPVFEAPEAGDAQPLIGLLIPAPFQPQSGPVAPIVPVTLKLVREDRPRPASALRCTLADLAEWAQMATRQQMAGLEAAWSPEGTILILGEHLPPITTEDRFWGRSVLVPLGLRPEPDVSEEVLKEALAIGDAIALVTAEGVEVIEHTAFGPLSRSGVRLAVAREDR